MNRGCIKSLSGHGGDRVRGVLRYLSRSEEGQALIEFALVVPLLLVLVLGIVDFARAVNYWNDENHLANLAARYAAVGSTPDWTKFPTTGTCTQPSDLSTLIKYEACLDSPELQSGSGGTTGIQGSGVSVCVSVPVNTVGNPVTVKVSANYKWLPLPKVLGGSSTFPQTSLSGSATMRLEAPTPSAWITTTSACP